MSGVEGTDQAGDRASFLLRGLLVPAFLAMSLSGFADGTKPAVLEISGYGFWGNREARKMLRLLQPEGKPPQFYDANFVEDAALILFSKLTRDGYLKPRLEITMTLADGTLLKRTWEEKLDPLLPRPLQVKRVRFRIRRGVLYYYDNVELQGLKSIEAKEAKRFFYESDFLIPIKTARIYTPARLDQALGSLREALARKGLQDAKVSVGELKRNDKTGGVRLRITVEEGLPTFVRSVQKDIYGPDDAAPRETATLHPAAAYSKFWEQSFTQELRAEQYRLGYPDAKVEVSRLQREEGDQSVQLDLRAQVHTGRQIELGRVTFEGHEKTRTSVMEHRVKLKEGELLNRIEVERGRQRLSRLGIFETVDVRYDPVDETTRDVTYEVKEGKVIDFSLLFGYGSYELLRGGFDLEQFNVLGRAHHARLRAIQSFKSSSGDYTYTMPEWIGEDISVFFNASGLRREELTFVREEFGASVGARRYFPAIDTDAGLRYSYQFLNARETGVALPEEVERTRVASFVLDLRHDRRDNPLLPKEGYNLFGTFETASAALGGEVDFQRLELGGSYHLKLAGGRILHFGVKHGVALTLGATRDELPFNKRFFPGGENSVRGFQQGEAAPRDAKGNIIGAETFVQGNFEFEQVLTPLWSIVLFVDGVGFARDVNDYPVAHELYSVGGGIRWKTIIGPARLEYGRNLNPRPGDPGGTLHFSLGFPF